MSLIHQAVRKARAQATLGKGDRDCLPASVSVEPQQRPKRSKQRGLFFGAGGSTLVALAIVVCFMAMPLLPRASRARLAEQTLLPQSPPVDAPNTREPALAEQRARSVETSWDASPLWDMAAHAAERARDWRERLAEHRRTVADELSGVIAFWQPSPEGAMAEPESAGSEESEPPVAYAPPPSQVEREAMEAFEAGRLFVPRGLVDVLPEEDASPVGDPAKQTEADPPAATDKLEHGREYVRELNVTDAPRLMLDGITASGDVRAAVINGMIVHERHVIEGTMVRRIESDRVHLERNGKRFILRLQ